ncbi:high affinity cationic amino acid transporter 1 isoform X2 [Atheta coriaria]|uniref:high affinity cationic amino acid transporter 1 isoform X2 n=1 Tax=Dalotia coriaria TaxID=877792 RepID=UPI0031F47232
MIHIAITWSSLMMKGIENYGGVGTHWALGSIVLVVLAASEYSGAGTLVALPVTAIAVSFAVLCGSGNAEKQINRHKGVVNTLTFFEIWLNVLQHLAAAATCARVASATMDYMSDQRSREWLFGLESHSLGEPWPDVLGIGIIAIVTALFMLGLEKSHYFCILLFLSIAISFLFFIVVGGYHTDISFWNWKEDFGKRSWGCLLTTSAMCSYGFTNSFPSALQAKKIKMFALVIIPLCCYSLIATIFTLMSHYREVAGIAIPLVRVFEVRDVDWARPVMAALTICVVCLPLTEIMPSLYNLLVKLAGRDWKVLASPILYRNAFTGAPVLAIFTAGSLASILAFACPLAYLVRMLNAAALFKCALKAICGLYLRYKPDVGAEEMSFGNTQGPVRYSKLQQPETTKISKFYDMLPSYLKKAKVTMTTSDVRNGPSDDKEYLLLDHYSKANVDLMADPESDSDANEPVTSNCSDGEDSDSATDIDAAVQEYRDSIQLANVNILSTNKSPTVTTGRVVICLIFILCILSALLTVGITYNQFSMNVVVAFCIATCLLTICTMPQSAPDPESLVKSPLVFPFVAFIAIILNAMLLTTLLFEIWHAILLWTCAGLLFYVKCGCCGCTDHQIHHYHTKTECSIASTANAHYAQQKIYDMDSILIPR